MIFHTHSNEQYNIILLQTIHVNIISFVQFKIKLLLYTNKSHVNHEHQFLDLLRMMVELYNWRKY